MKALFLCASGNTSGYTFSMCQEFRSVAEGLGMDVSLVDLSKMAIGDCTGCRACHGGGGCVISDDMDSILGMMADTDLLVLATPIRFSGPSSIMKRFLDRLNPFWNSTFPHPGYVCAMLCGGSPAPKFSNALSEMKSASITVGMKWVGEMCVPDTDSGKKVDDEIRRFAEKVVSSLQ